jgi:ABC-type multidrug transport system ATPase subunit
MFMPDFPPLYADMTVLQHLALLLQLYEREKEGRESEIIEVLRDLDMLTLCDTRVRHLSRGQGYKTALAAMVLVSPDVWLIDEPFASGMDPNGISYFKRRSRQAASEGKLVIYSTQILDIAESFSDRVCVIHKGDVRAFDSVEALSRSNSRDSESGVLEQVLQRLREEDQ